MGQSARLLSQSWGQLLLRRRPYGNSPLGGSRNRSAHAAEHSSREYSSFSGHGLPVVEGPIQREEVVRKDAPRSLLLRHVDVFQFGVAIHCSHAQVPTQPALLESTEGCLDVDARMGIDAQHAAFHATGNAQRSLQVVGPKRTAQSVA